MTYEVMVVVNGGGYAEAVAAGVHAGVLLRQWRARRRLSQLDLSSRTGVSTRHLSYVETGRARPSRDLLLFLAEELAIPQRSTNELLLAAGFAPVYGSRGLGDEAMSQVRRVIRLMLDGNDPNPTTVIDIRWNVIDANPAALWLCAGVADELLHPPINMARLSLHPDGLATRVVNFDEYAGHLLRTMRHTLAVTHDPALAALLAECEAYTASAAPAAATGDDVVLPMHMKVGDHHLAFLSTITTFGAARDVTVSELSIETLYPADDTTRATLHGRPWLAAAPTA